MTVSDIELVQDYARSGSEAAFATLVSRHVNLVFSVALRCVKDTHLAEEITQTVFVILARKARSLGDKTVVSSWLCQTARFTSVKALTMRRRREAREQEAFMQSSLNEEESRAWLQIEPLLDTAMGELPRKDHDALVVRFLEGKSFKEVSSALGTTEAGAKMRVNRALEKMKKFFTKRGITLSASVIAGAVSASAVQAAPASLAGAVTLAAVQGTVVTTSTITLIESTLKLMTWTKIKTAAVAGVVAMIAIGTTTLTIQRSQAAPEDSKTEAAFPGYATPESTLKTLIAALGKADHEKFAEGCTPQKAEQFRNRNAQKSPEELKQDALGQAKAFSTYEIGKVEKISETVVHLHVKATGKSDGAHLGDRNLIMKMVKIGKDWKYDGDQR